MDLALLLARLALAVVFAVAGVTKLADREGSKRAVTDFGVPAAVAAQVGILLPLAELLVAILLVPGATGRFGALGAIVLLVLFVVGITANLARGRAPECHCFGQLHSEPIGWTTLARNGVLLVVAVFVLVLTPGNPSAAFGGSGRAEDAALGIASAALVLAGSGFWLVIGVLNRVNSLQSGFGGAETRAGLPVESRAPSFVLPTLEGERVALDDLLESGKPVMVVFTSPTCAPCDALLPEIGRWQREHDRQLTVAVLTTGALDESRRKSAEHGLKYVLLQREREVEAAYRVPGTPGAVVVWPDGMIGSPVATGADMIRALLGQLLSQLSSALIRLEPDASELRPNGSAPVLYAPLQIGEEAPDIVFRGVMGKDVRLSDFRGKDTLVLFWNTHCGFCQQMLPALRAWEVDPPEGAPRLLIVLPDSMEQNQVIHFRSPTVIDRGSAGSRALGAPGTPMAVLIDAEGRVASGVAEGAAQIWPLVNRSAVH